MISIDQLCVRFSENEEQDGCIAIDQFGQNERKSYTLPDTERRYVSEQIFIAFQPGLIRMWNMDEYTVISMQQRSLEILNLWVKRQLGTELSARARTVVTVFIGHRDLLY